MNLIYTTIPNHVILSQKIGWFSYPDSHFMFYLYAHYSTDTNELFYIGVAKSKKRFTSKYSRNSHWVNYVNKHGFYFKILFTSKEWEVCLNKEKELIKKYGRKDIKTGVLLNMTDGGEGFLNPSLESRNKISIKLKGIKRSSKFKEDCKIRNIGKIISIETKEKMRETHIGLNTWQKGRILSDETKEKISKAKKGISIGIGKILSAEHKKAISNGMLKKISKN